jgi:hypothetical protein
MEIKTILDLPEYLREIGKFLEDKETDIDNMQMGNIMTWMFEGVDAEEAAKRLENR